MISALVCGKLYGRAQERMGKNGKPFVVAKLTANAGDGAGYFVNLITFDGAACAALLALDAGDALAVAGEATPKSWADRDGNPRAGLDLVAQQVLTPYHVSRKRRAMQPPGEE